MSEVTRRQLLGLTGATLAELNAALTVHPTSVAEARPLPSKKHYACPPPAPSTPKQTKQQRIVPTPPTGVLFGNPIVKPLASNGAFMAFCTATFYLTGTTMLAAIYADGTLTTPLPNPLTADSTGSFPAVYLDPNVIYRVVIKAPTGVLVSDTDPYVPSSVALLTQSLIGKSLYPRTPAEVAVNATIVNANYPPMYVDRYGTNTSPGVTSMVAAFNTAIAVAQNNGGTVRYGASGVYFVDGPIDCTTDTCGNQNGVTIRPDITNNDGSPAATIFARHTGNAVFDCTGNTCIEFENVGIQTDTSVFPKTSILLARAVTSSGNNSQVNRLTRCRLFGSYSIATGALRATMICGSIHAPESRHGHPTLVG